MAKPDFSLMWANFPDHDKYPTLEALFIHIGGMLGRTIDLPGFGPTGNTCAVRMSRALNYGAFPISPRIVAALGLHTLTGADRKLYLFRVREMRTYLQRALGVSPVSVHKDFDGAFSGQQGIVAFTVEGWSNTTGHIALWDGKSFKEPAYDDYRTLRDNPETRIREPETVAMNLWAM